MRFNPSHKLLFSFLSIFLTCFFGMSVLCSYGNEPNNGTTAHIVFTDALGRTVSLSSQPQRTACLLGSFADVWVLSGGTLCDLKTVVCRDIVSERVLHIGDLLARGILKTEDHCAIAARGGLLGDLYARGVDRIAEGVKIGGKKHAHMVCAVV